MINSIIFIIIFVAVYVAFMMIAKTEDGEKLSLLNSMVVCFITEVSVGVIFAYILFKCGIFINLWIMCAIYIPILLLAILLLVKKKAIQKYSFQLIDLLNYAVIIAIILVVIWRIFSFKLNYHYINTDPAVHMANAIKVIQKGKLSSMPYAPLYNGVVMQLIVSFIPSFPIYKAFIIADTVSNFLSGAMFYILLSEVIRKDLVKKVSPFITALYFVGWPIYNYVEGGFVYWGIAATLVMYGLYIIVRFSKKKIAAKPFAVLIVLNLIAIALCYLLFVPYIIVMYAVIILQLEWKIIPNKKRLIGIASIVMLGCLLAAFGFVMLYFHGDVSKVFYWLAFDGGIHRSLYKDIIYFIPFVVVLLFDMRKKKAINIMNVAFLIFALMVVASLVLELTGIMSSYYYYKLYYILWILGWINTALGIEIVLEEKQKWAIGYAIMLGVMFVYGFTPLEDWEYDSYGFNASKQSPEFPMYSNVGSFIKNRPNLWAYPEEEDFFDVIDFVVKSGEEVPELANEKNGYWYKKITGSQRILETDINNVETEFFEEACKDTKYFCIEKTTDYYNMHKEELSKKYDIIYDADYGVVYRIK